MKRKSFIAVLLVLSCLLTGCSMRYGTGNVELEGSGKGKLNYLVTRIENVPDDWSVSGYQSYYYNVDTKIVYFGSSSLSSTCAVLVELRSADYRNYVYDKETNQFVGISW